MVAEAHQAARMQAELTQFLGQGVHGINVDLDSVKKPTLSLMGVMKLCHLRQMHAHVAHLVGEGVDALAQLMVLEVA